ncbi:MAG TPA: hypothetical protein VF329_06275 [Gammaproteobacteria bacterium]
MLRAIIPALRSYDLVLNEAKSSIMPKAALVTEEPDLEQLFSDAFDEVASEVDDDKSATTSKLRFSTHRGRGRGPSVQRPRRAGVGMVCSTIF